MAKNTEEIATREKRITVRMTTDEYLKFKKMAGKNTISNYIRGLLGFAKKEKIIEKYRYCDEYWKSTKRIEALLRLTATNINQIAIVINANKERLTEKRVEYLTKGLMGQKGNVIELIEEVRKALTILQKDISEKEVKS